ncbi:MAG: hypothetical protein B6244_00310 [Candidatus Cloacimonetes bacterium 4572_55]|nr:MAG: hypothetical protein B6244_00310 [Candidatus Cloacimonetes bacterium 4572_55]
MERPKFFSWEFLGEWVSSPYEAVTVLSKESRRLNSVPYELQENQRAKKTTQAMIKLINGEIKYNYDESGDRKKTRK